MLIKEDNPFIGLSEFEKILLPEIIEEWETNSLAHWEELRNLDNLRELRRFGHTVKSQGRQYRISELAEWGYKIENAAAEGDQDALETLFPLYPEVVKSARKKVDKWLPLI